MPVGDDAKVFAAAVGAYDDRFDLDALRLELDHQIARWIVLGHTPTPGVSRCHAAGFVGGGRTGGATNIEARARDAAARSC